MEILIRKLNNIERNVKWVERYYRLGGKTWYVGKTKLFVDKHVANEKEIDEFLKLKEEFNQ